jgi:putative tricarboxylic transport membrane protein
MTKRLAEVLILGGYLILAVLLFRSTAGYPPSVQGSTAMYVRFLGVALGSLCALELLFWVQKLSKEQPVVLTIAAAPLRFWGLLILLILYAVALTPFGFYLSSAIFLPVAMLLLGARKPLSIVLTSGGVLLFVYLVFYKLLAVPLPASTLF